MRDPSQRYRFHSLYHEYHVSKVVPKWTTFIDFSQAVPTDFEAFVGNMPLLRNMILNVDLLPQDFTSLHLPDLTEMTLVGNAGNLPTWIKNLPALRFLRFDKQWQAPLPADLAALPHLVEMEVFPEPIHQASKILPTLAIEKLWLDDLRLDDPVLPALGGCKSLQSLHMSQKDYEHLHYRNKKEKKTPRYVLPAEWGNLTNLCTLEIRTMAHLALPDAWKKLNNLEEITLYASQIEGFPFEAENLLNLENLYLSGAGSFDLKEILEKCNPKALKKFSWQRGGIKEVPDIFTDFKALLTLNLSENDFQYLPTSLLKLSNLSTLEVKDTPFSDKTYIGRYTSWISFKGSVRHQNFDTQALALSLLQRDEARVLTFPAQAWIPLLACDVDYLRFEFFVEKYKPFTLPADLDKSKTVFYLVGKPPMYYNKTAFKKIIKKHALRFVDTFDHTVTHVLVGNAPTVIKSDVSHVQQILGFSIFVDWLNQFEKPAFQESPLDEESVQSLRNLLASGEANNINLALQIMENGVPEMLYPTFFWLAFNLPAHTEKNYQAIFRKYLPSMWQNAVQRYRRWDNDAILRDLMRQKDLPTEALFMSLLMDFADIGTYFQQRLYIYSLQLGGKPANWVIAKYLENGVLDFQRPDISVFPADLATFPDIEVLKCPQSKGIIKALDILKALPKLREIDFYELPKDNILAKLRATFPAIKLSSRGEETKF